MRPYLLLLVLLAACGRSAPAADSAAAAQADRSPEGNRTAKELAYIKEQEGRVRAKLRDPQAAEFQQSRVHYGVAPVVCGAVNGTSGVGSHTGFQRFISGGQIQVLEEETQPGEMDKLWPQVCR